MVSPHHRRAAVSRDRLALGSRRLRTGLVHRQVARDRPLGTAERLCGLVQLRRHVEVVDRRLAAIDAIEADKRVDFEVCEVEVNVDGVEADEEVDERLLLRLGYVLEQGVGDGLARGDRLVHADLEGQRLRIDVANINASLVRKEDIVAITVRVDADVVLGVGRMREEGLDDEVVESARDRLDLVIHAGNQQSFWHEGADVRYVFDRRTDGRRYIQPPSNWWGCLFPSSDCRPDIGASPPGPDADRA